MHNNEKIVKRRLKMKKTAFIIVNKIEKIYDINKTAQLLNPPEMILFIFIKTNMTKITK